MNAKPLSERELKRLAKIDRKLLGGRLRFGLFGLFIGICGGLAWAAMMGVLTTGSSGFHLTAPGPDAAHPGLEQVIYWLAARFGPAAAITIAAAGMFGALGGGLSFGLAWPLLVQNHADLAARAIACKQFEPKFSSAALRRKLAQA